MDKVQKWAAECAAKEMVEILKAHSYSAQYADNLEEARKMVLDLVPEGSSVAVGGSVTLEEMDLVETFRSGNYSFFERYKQPDWPTTVEVYRQSLACGCVCIQCQRRDKKRRNCLSGLHRQPRGKHDFRAKKSCDYHGRKQNCGKFGRGDCACEKNCAAEL